MKTAAIIIIGILLFGTAATYHRYQSFNPCDWMEQDLIVQSSLPKLVVQGKVKAKFLLQGIIDPTPVQCVKMWWKLKADGDLVPLKMPEQTK